jgi:hypothetical protein
MKKIVTLLLTSLIVFLMFVGPGNVVKADENHEGHGCGCVVEPVLGAEKNKIISNLLKSNEFKVVKKEQQKNGFNLQGVKNIEVFNNFIFNHKTGELEEVILMVGVPLISKDGTVTMAVFFNGQYMDPNDLPQPTETEQTLEN